jgi:lipoyl(octanoyl) transferase
MLRADVRPVNDAEHAAAPIWRLILSDAVPGARAMAVDEALLEACAADPDVFVPAVRLYAFDPPCLSLGRFQRTDDVDRDACRRLGADVVRRPTGGRAVLHDRCLTYALVAPVDAPPFAGGVRASAERIGAALAAGLGRLAGSVITAPAPARGHRPADCFALPGAGEVVADGRKLAGSAQLRRDGAALQHGTVRLRADAGLIAPLLRDSPAAEATAGPTALDRLCGRPATFTEVALAVTAGIAETFGVRFCGRPLSAEEERRAVALEHERYRRDTWTFAR